MVIPDDKPQSTSRLASPSPGSEKVVIDPTKGGAVSPKEIKQAKALEVAPGLWIWDGLVKVLEVDLFSVAWEVRHGAAMALRELLKVQGKFGGMKCMSPYSINLHALMEFQTTRLGTQMRLLMKHGATTFQLNSSAYLS